MPASMRRARSRFGALQPWVEDDPRRLASFQGAFGADAAPGVDEGEGIPGGADAGGSRGVPGAFATTDDEGSEGSDDGVATALALAGARVADAERPAAAWSRRPSPTTMQSTVGRERSSSEVAFQSPLTLLHRANGTRCARLASRHGPSCAGLIGIARGRGIVDALLDGARRTRRPWCADEVPDLPAFRRRNARRGTRAFAG
jgi:hypothetical protein